MTRRFCSFLICYSCHGMSLPAAPRCSKSKPNRSGSKSWKLLGSAKISRRCWRVKSCKIRSSRTVIALSAIISRRRRLSSARDQAIALYREGLSLCPEDEVAHYELGRALADRGRYLEAEREFEAALNLRPDFTDAKRQLESIRKKR